MSGRRLTPEESAALAEMASRLAQTVKKAADTMVEGFGVLAASLHLMWASLDDEAADIIAAHPDLAELNVQLDNYYP